MSKTTINNAVLISNMVSFDHVINNKITKSFQKSENIMYGFLNYDKNYLSMNDLQTGVFKSVIFSINIRWRYYGYDRIWFFKFNETRYDNKI